MPTQPSPQAARILLRPFMSVFGERKVHGEGDTVGTQGITRAEIRTNTNLSTTTPDSQFSIQHQHRGSTSTTTSDSTDSSPTSTISMVDSSSMTDPSPRSSPESPVSFPSKGVAMPPSDSLDLLTSPGHSSDQSRAISPVKKARNTKGLSLNMGVSKKQPQVPPRLALMTGASADAHQDLSGPSSPSFVLPPKPPKRRPSNLGLIINTPVAGSLPEKTALRIAPPTPSSSVPNIRRNHNPLSLSVFSPTTEPEGGMQLPPFGNQPTTGRFVRPRQHSVRSQYPHLDSGHSSLTNSQRLDELEEDEYAPLSQEAKSPAYPQGPICIYDPFVYLYLEPTNQEALTFDVILNVAREVLNPFSPVIDKEEVAVPQVASDVQDLGLDDKFPPILEVAEPAAAAPAAAARSSPEIRRSHATVLFKTAKATKHEPEYIHVPWDHNTNIVEDMLRLVEVIDERVRQGKRVLVHCQCGVSRSASLIVAYGLYKNPNLTVNEAYDAVKKRSKWIGPNMNLIYQLSEFKEKLSARIPPPEHWGGRRSFGFGRSKTISDGSPQRLSSPLADSSDNPDSEPHSAPLPGLQDESCVRSDILSPIPPSPALDMDGIGGATLGPSSAPSAFSWIPVGRSTKTRGRLWDHTNGHTCFVPPPLPPSAAYADSDGNTVSLEDACRPSVMDSTQLHPSDAYIHDAQSHISQINFQSKKHNQETLATPFILSPQAAEFTPGVFYQAAVSNRQVAPTTPDAVD